MTNLESDLQLIPIVINAVGQLCHANTHQPLRLVPGAHLHLLLHHPDQLLPEPEPFQPKQYQVVAPGDTLTFVLHQTPWGRAEVTVQFPGGLSMFQHEEAETPHCPEQVDCLVIDVRALSNPHKSVPGFSPIPAVSVNNAYTEASKRFEPLRKSNTANIYRLMRTRAGRLLPEEWALKDAEATGSGRRV